MTDIACAILVVNGRYALQYRGPKAPTHPNVWGFFGGHIEEGESPLVAVTREIDEELGISGVQYEFLRMWINKDEEIAPAGIYYFYVADVTAQWESHVLTEGERAELFGFNELSVLKLPKMCRDILTEYHCKRLQYTPYHVGDKLSSAIWVMCHGCFDHLHYGHIEHLKASAELGLFLAVSLVGDKFVRKGPDRPVYDQFQRAEMLLELRCVDLVMVTTDLGPFDHIKALRPAVYCKGRPYTMAELPEKKLVESLGGRVVIPEWTTDFSTTALNERIIEQGLREFGPALTSLAEK